MTRRNLHCRTFLRSIYLRSIYLRRIYLRRIYLRRIYLRRIYLRRIYLRQPASLILALVVAGCCAFWSGSSAAAAVPHRVQKHDFKEQVEQLEEQWRLAQLSGDVSTMDKLLSDDYIGISLNGQVNTKAQQLERTGSRRIALTRLELSDRKVKLIGTIAIVTSRAEVEGTSDSQSVKGVYRYTRVYQRVANGTWKITSFEATRTPQSVAAAETETKPAPR